MRPRATGLRRKAAARQFLGLQIADIATGPGERAPILASRRRLAERIDPDRRRRGVVPDAGRGGRGGRAILAREAALDEREDAHRP
jgi:hypothetical protein